MTQQVLMPLTDGDGFARDVSFTLTPERFLDPLDARRLEPGTPTEI